MTAKHVAQRLGDGWFVRLSRVDGGIDDVMTPHKWIEHPDTDVAVVPFGFPDDGEYLTKAQAIETFAQEEGPSPGLGDTVFFVGLFASLASMHVANHLMVRSGTIGALGDR